MCSSTFTNTGKFYDLKITKKHINNIPKRPANVLWSAQQVLYIVSCTQPNYALSYDSCNDSVFVCTVVADCWELCTFSTSCERSSKFDLD